MNQIKKFAWSGIAVSLAAFVAMAMVVGTAYADVDAVAGEDVDVGEEGDLVIDTTAAGEAILITQNASGTGAVEFDNGEETILVTSTLTGGSGGTEGVTVPYTGSDAGIVIFEVNEVGDPVEDRVTEAITVTGAAATVATLTLTAPGSVAEDGVTSASVRTSTSEGAGVGGQAVTIIAGGGGTLFVADGLGETDPCLTTTQVNDQADEDAIDECIATTSSTAGAGLGSASFAVGATGDVGDEISILAFTGTRSAADTIIIGGAVDMVSVSAPDLEVGEQGEITVTVVDEDGNPAAPGTFTVDASAGVVFGCDANTAGGTGTCDFIAPSTAQTVTIVASAGGETSTTTATIGAGTTPPPPTGGEGTFTGDIAASGSSLVVWNGGTNAQLAAAAAANGAISVFVTVNGEFVGYIVGAPAFVNATFTALFPNGVPAGTPVILTK